MIMRFIMLLVFIFIYRYISLKYNFCCNMWLLKYTEEKQLLKFLLWIKNKLEILELFNSLQIKYKL